MPSWRLVIVLVTTAAAFAAGGCKRDAPKNDPPRPVAVVVSGDTAGWLTPCGCALNQSGGLLRRGTYMADLGKAADVAYADAGGAAGGDSEYHKIKFEAILAGEKEMGIRAHNVGKSEAALGAAYLRDVGTRLGVPFVSANVRDGHGRPVAEVVRIATAGGKRIAFVGVLSPKLVPAGLTAAEPRQAILDAAGGVKGQYDSLVVLAYLPQDELEQLAVSLPEADAVIGGPTGQAIPPRQVGPTLLAASTNKGKFLIELRATASGGGGWSGKVVEMAATLADDNRQTQGVRKYLADLNGRDFPARVTGLAPELPPGMPADYRIAGSTSCLECHKDDQSVWAHSKHAHAWETIQAKGFHVDSYCQQCHTTGYGLPGGFESRATTAGLVQVGCENCHGPSQAHVKDPKVRTPFAAADQCARCHDHENSPAFAYDVYWPRTRHGRGQRPEPPGAGPTTQPAGQRSGTHGTHDGAGGS